MFFGVDVVVSVDVNVRPPSFCRNNNNNIISTIYYHNGRALSHAKASDNGNNPIVLDESPPCCSQFRRRLVFFFSYVALFEKQLMVSVSRLQMKHWRYELLTGWRRSVGYQEVVSKQNTIFCILFIIHIIYCGTVYRTCNYLRRRSRVHFSRNVVQ